MGCNWEGGGGSGRRRRTDIGSNLVSRHFNNSRTSSAASEFIVVEAIIVGAVGDGEVAVGGVEPVAVPVLEIYTQFTALCGRQSV